MKCSGCDAGVERRIVEPMGVGQCARSYVRSTCDSGHGRHARKHLRFVPRAEQADLIIRNCVFLGQLTSAATIEAKATLCPTCPHIGNGYFGFAKNYSSKSRLIISITPAVAPWIPKAVALVPPCRRTIAASAMGMIEAASMNQPSG